jgi:WD40 repeat protein
MFTRVRENPLTILFGQSGLGKSSLLGAGLVPKLRVERFRPVHLRLVFSPEAPSLVAQTRVALRQALRTVEQTALTRGAGEIPAALDSAHDSAGDWRAGEANSQNPSPDSAASLWEILQHIPSRPENLRESPPVLIFDQFEEMFTLAGRRQLEVKEWFDQIADLVENRPSAALQERFRSDRSLARQFDPTPTPARIVITLREDYLSHLESWKGVLPSLMRNRMPLNLLSGPQALEAVVRPGSRGAFPIVDETVGAQIVRKVAREPDTTPLEAIKAVPPFLSLLCEQLNAARLASKLNRITPELVATRGDDILDDYYEASFRGQPVAVRCFVEDRLVSGGGHRNTLIREDVLNELRAAGVTNPESAIDGLIARRLLTAEDRGGFPRLELTHDVLTPLVVRSRTTRQEQDALLTAQRQRRRQRSIALALAAVAMVFAGLALFGWVSYRQAQDQRRFAKEQTDLAQRRAQEAESRHREAQQRLGALLTERGRQALLRGGLDHAFLFLAAAYQQDTNNEAMKELLGEASRRLGKPPTILFGHTDQVTEIDVSPNGRFIASGSQDGTTKIWDVQNGQLVTSFDDYLDAVSAVAFDSAGGRILTASGDWTARIYSLESTNAPVVLVGHFDRINTAVFGPLRNRVLTGSNDKTARFWDATSGNCLLELKGHTDWVTAAALSSSGDLAATTGIDGSIRLWDLRTGRIKCDPYKNHGPVVTLAFSPRDGQLAWGDNEGKLGILNTIDGSLTFSAIAHQGAVHKVLFSSDGALVFSGGGDGQVRVWESQKQSRPPLELARPEIEVTGAGNAISALKLSRDGHVLVAGTRDGMLCMWEIPQGQLLGAYRDRRETIHSIAFGPGKMVAVGQGDTIVLRELEPTASEQLLDFEAPKEAGPLETAAFSPDGKWIVVGGRDGMGRLFDARTLRQRHLLQHGDHSSWVVQAAFDATGERVLTAGGRSIKVWDSSSGRLLWQIPDDTGTNFIAFAAFGPGTNQVLGVKGNLAQSLSFWQIWNIGDTNAVSTARSRRTPFRELFVAPDGAEVVSVGWESVVRWELTSGVLLNTAVSSCAAFSPDGVFFAWGTPRGEVAVSSRSGHEVFTVNKHLARVGSVAFSPSGQQLLSSSEDGFARLWDFRAQRGLAEFNHGAPLKSALFSPDGDVVVTVGRDHVVKLWSAGNGRMLRELKGHTKLITAAAFDREGTRLLTAGWDGSARIWQIRTPLPPPETVAVDALTRALPGGFRELQADPELEMARLTLLDAATLAAPHALQSAQFQPEAMQAELGRQEHLRGKEREAQAVLNAAGKSADLSEASRFILARISEALAGYECSLTGHISSVRSITVFPNSPLVASSGTDKTVRLWNLETGNLVHVFSGHRNQVFDALLTTNQQRVVTYGLDNTIRVWDPGRGDLLHLLQDGGTSFDTAAVSEDGRWVAGGDFAGTVHVWSLADGTLRTNFSVGTNSVRDVKFSAGGERLLVQSGGRLTGWNWPLALKAFDFKCESTNSTAPSFWVSRTSPDGRWFAAAGSDHVIRLWEADTAKLVKVLPAHKDTVNAIRFSSDSALLISASADGCACVWSVSSGRLESNLSVGGDVGDARMSPDGQCVITASGGCLQVWNSQTGNLIGIVNTSPYVSSFNVTSDSRRLITGLASGEVQVWRISDLSTPRVRQTLGFHVENALFSPRGSFCLVETTNGVQRLWSVSSGALVTNFAHTPTRQLAAEFSADDSLLACAETNGVVVYETSTGHRRLAINNAGLASSFTLDPLASFVAVGTENGAWFIRSIAAGIDTVTVTNAHDGSVTAIACSPDRNLLATGGKDHRVFLWDIHTGQRRGVFSGHKGAVLSLKFSPDGKILLSTSRDRSACLWSVTDGKRLSSLYGHKGAILASVFSADGGAVGTLGEDMNFHLWMIPSGNHSARMNAQGEYAQRIVSLPNLPFLTWADEVGRVFVENTKTGKRVHSWQSGSACAKALGFSDSWSSILCLDENGRLSTYSTKPNDAPPKLAHRTENEPRTTPKL